MFHKDDKDHFLYPYAIDVIAHIDVNPHERIIMKSTTQGYRNLALVARKEKEVNNKQCMNTLSP